TRASDNNRTGRYNRSCPDWYNREGIWQPSCCRGWENTRHGAEVRPPIWPTPPRGAEPSYIPCVPASSARTCSSPSRTSSWSVPHSAGSSSSSCGKNMPPLLLLRPPAVPAGPQRLLSALFSSSQPSFLFPFAVNQLFKTQRLVNIAFHLQLQKPYGRHRI